ncbi:hypothetical protein EVAR_33650_1 [Eumeta japonica]|uniref:Uncharacterized protein n=1 Tax=Eumeta variegata TaxID=151549 RepID=A0A4C1VNY2_EUMVA|nr:hypothetical protein EVAR_33650_1 [Eumeta japonica]
MFLFGVKIRVVFDWNETEGAIGTRIETEAIKGPSATLGSEHTFRATGRWKFSPRYVLGHDYITRRRAKDGPAGAEAPPRDAV